MLKEKNVLNGKNLFEWFWIIVYKCLKVYDFVLLKV